MAGWGSVFAQGVIGAVGGAGQAVATNAMQEIRDETIRLRDERLSRLRMGEYQTELQMRQDAADASEKKKQGEVGDFFKRTQSGPEMPVDPVDAEGAVDPQSQASPREVAKYQYDEALKSGNKGIIETARQKLVDVQGAEDKQTSQIFKERELSARDRPKPLPPEQADYYRAMASRVNAETDAIRNGQKYGKSAKTQLPSIKVERDANGESFSVDANSGAVGVLVPGEDAVKGKTHWFGADEPAKPAVPAHMEWSLNGKKLPNGLADIYPDIRARLDGAAARSERGGSSHASAGAAVPKAGDVVHGLRFRGGNPNEKANWQRTADEQRPAGYPDAQQAPDGGWYVKRGGSFYRVRQEAAKAASPQPPKSEGIIDDARQRETANMELRFEQEDRELQMGKRRDYSPEVRAWLEAQAAERSRKFHAADADLLAQEQARMLRRPDL